MSFHTYLRKLTSGVGKGKFLALEDISCKIKSGKCRVNLCIFNFMFRIIDHFTFRL